MTSSPEPEKEFVEKAREVLEQSDITTKSLVECIVLALQSVAEKAREEVEKEAEELAGTLEIFLRCYGEPKPCDCDRGDLEQPPFVCTYHHFESALETWREKHPIRSAIERGRPK